MKTKLLSKLIVMACMAVMIAGCGDGKKTEGEIDAGQTPIDSTMKSENSNEQAFLASDCEVCNKNDTYQILKSDAAKLISAFHNIVLTKNSKINNAGGYFTFDSKPTSDKSSKKKSLMDYTSFKFHWAVEDTINDLQRLFISYEANDRKCDDSNVYSGNSGIEGPELYSTFPENDILPFLPKGDNLTEKMAETMIENHIVRIAKSYKREVAKSTAMSLLASFRSHNDVNTFYKCDDIVFDKIKTFYPIALKSGKESFVYFFGLDTTQIHHRLRLIIAGFDNNNKIIFFDGTKTLLRENSRPRP
jgi:hypothetical protein